jgi:hypothetical protein
MIIINKKRRTVETDRLCLLPNRTNYLVNFESFTAFEIRPLVML